MANSLILTRKPTLFTRRYPTRERVYILSGNRETVFRISVIAILTLLSLIVTYLFIANSIVGSVYQLKKYEEVLTKLKEDGRVLEINATQVKSTGNLEELAKNFGMVEFSDVGYLRTDTASIVALEKENYP